MYLLSVTENFRMKLSVAIVMLILAFVACIVQSKGIVKKKVTSADSIQARAELAKRILQLLEENEDSSNREIIEKKHVDSENMFNLLQKRSMGQWKNKKEQKKRKLGDKGNAKRILDIKENMKKRKEEQKRKMVKVQNHLKIERALRGKELKRENKRVFHNKREFGQLKSILTIAATKRLLAHNRFKRSSGDVNILQLLKRKLQASTTQKRAKAEGVKEYRKRQENDFSCTKINITSVGQSGTLSSPGYPNDYPGMMYQCAEIVIASGQHVLFKLVPANGDEIDMEGDNQMCYDSLRFIDTGTNVMESTGDTDVLNEAELYCNFDDFESDFQENPENIDSGAVTLRIENCWSALGEEVHLDDDLELDEIMTAVDDLYTYIMDLIGSDYSAAGDTTQDDYIPEPYEYHEAEFCGKMKKDYVLDLFVTFSSSARVEFLSNNNPNGRGYQITYESISDTDVCDVSEYIPSFMFSSFCYDIGNSEDLPDTSDDSYSGEVDPGINWPECKEITVKDDKGVLIESTGYPYGYEAYTRDCWHFIGNRNENLVVEVPQNGSFSTEETFDLVGFLDDNEEYGNISLRDGDYSAGDVLFISSSTNERAGIWIYFYADYSVQFGGFKLQISSVKNPADAEERYVELSQSLGQCDRFITHDTTFTSTDLGCIAIIGAPEGANIELNFPDGLKEGSCIITVDKGNGLDEYQCGPKDPFQDVFVASNKNLQVAGNGYTINIKITSE